MAHADATGPGRALDAVGACFQSQRAGLCTGFLGITREVRSTLQASTLPCSLPATALDAQGSEKHCMSPDAALLIIARTGHCCLEYMKASVIGGLLHTEASQHPCYPPQSVSDMCMMALQCRRHFRAVKLEVTRGMVTC